VLLLVLVLEEILTTDLKLAPFPTRSPLPFAALPSISLFPSAQFTDLTDRICPRNHTKITKEKDPHLSGFSRLFACLAGRIITDRPKEIFTEGSSESVRERAKKTKIQFRLDTGRLCFLRFSSVKL